MSLVEEAYRLASSGDVGDMRSLRNALFRGGFTWSSIESHLGGSSISRDLQRRIRASRVKTEAG